MHEKSPGLELQTGSSAEAAMMMMMMTSLWVVSVTWSFNVRLLIIVMPSSFALVTNSISFPSMMIYDKKFNPLGYVQ